MLITIGWFLFGMLVVGHTSATFVFRPILKLLFFSIPTVIKFKRRQVLTTWAPCIRYIIALFILIPIAIVLTWAMWTYAPAVAFRTYIAFAFLFTLTRSLNDIKATQITMWEFFQNNAQYFDPRFVKDVTPRPLKDVTVTPQLQFTPEVHTLAQFVLNDAAMLVQLQRVIPTVAKLYHSLPTKSGSGVEAIVQLVVEALNGMLTSRILQLRSAGQSEQADGLQGLMDSAGSHFVANEILKATVKDYTPVEGAGGR